VEIWKQQNVMETEKWTVTRLESGAGDGNRTHTEAWEARNKTLKAIDLAALSFPSDGLNWKLDGNRKPDRLPSLVGAGFFLVA
jgi:hypothetical protein